MVQRELAISRTLLRPRMVSLTTNVVSVVRSTSTRLTLLIPLSTRMATIRDVESVTASMNTGVLVVSIRSARTAMEIYILRSPPMHATVMAHVPMMMDGVHARCLIIVVKLVAV